MGMTGGRAKARQDTFDTKTAVQNHGRDVQYFKRHSIFCDELRDHARRSRP
jgi:hypothetical protein